MSEPFEYIVGTDGYHPSYEPNDIWKHWGMNDVYLGANGRYKHIPKVNDYVTDPETGATYIVTDVNNITAIPELTPRNFTGASVDPIPNATPDNYRLYYDTSVTPAILMCDAFMHIYNSTATVARIYKGTVIDPTKIISEVYDNSGNYVSSDIPLALVLFDSHDNYGIRSIPACNTTATLQTGDMCSVVVFDGNGVVVNRSTCVVEDTTYIPQAYAEQHYITNIYLKSSFIAETNDAEIHYPVNLPIGSFMPTGVVVYNDGSKLEYPIGTGKFDLLGIDSFLSSVIGQRVPLVLRYNLAPNEAVVGGLTVSGNHVTRPYDLVVSNSQRSYNVKLFIYPVFVDNINGYILKAFMMSADRDIIYNVSDKIAVSTGSPAFNGTLFGVTQRITFQLDLSDVTNVYQHFIHAQTVDISLKANASDVGQINVWEVGSEAPSAVPYYGTNLRANYSGAGNRLITIDNGLSQPDFISQVYMRTLPLVIPTAETVPMEPTHIKVQQGTESFTVPIAQYTDTFTFTHDINLYDNVEITFLRYSGGTYLSLSIASLCVR